MDTEDGKYRTMARIFHADRTGDACANHKALAAARCGADSTFRTGVTVAEGELFIAMPRRLSLLLTRVLRREGDIALSWQAMPRDTRRDYADEAIADEMQATNEIEGVRSTRRETRAAVRAARRESRGAQGDSIGGAPVRFSELALLYLAVEGGDVTPPQTVEDIRSIYDRATQGEISQADVPDGELFRREDVEILGPHGDPIHRGVSGEARISALLTQMIALMWSDSIPTLLSAIAAHYLFEYIHPFYDGNGRTGRYLLALSLARDLTPPTVLSLNRVIADDKSAYYKALTDAEDPLNCGELTFFALTLLDFIAAAQERAADTLR